MATELQTRPQPAPPSQSHGGLSIAAVSHAYSDGRRAAPGEVGVEPLGPVRLEPEPAAGQADHHVEHGAGRDQGRRRQQQRLPATRTRAKPERVNELLLDFLP